MNRLEGKVALIAGTARGEGRAVALRFAPEGALAVGGDLSHEEAARTQRLIAREGGTALTPGTLDVTDEDSVRSWTEEAVDAFGGVDILYADAGAVRCGATASQPYDEFSSTMRAEPDSVWPAVPVARPLRVASRGSVLTAGQAAGPTGSLTGRRTAHSTAKAAVIALSGQLAEEGAPYGVGAHCVGPGVINAEGSRSGLLAAGHPVRGIDRRLPVGRVGVADDVADAAEFLTSDESAYITGAHPAVDGGRNAVLPGTTIRKDMRK
ncbi:SDR family oxidoreductase [Streptomyces phaeoluteigriseus]|uniref:SDR family oxidoreductase n=1 Tax=Streptomyces phaeoluteigriseus TaxID=114686 RepID=A0ABY4ZBE7_9ACTN|nr:SDR family oxidoreductase [Streptomyces phaeoluteigriseus]USQ86369.1 SDR family oxidoreductase [Streptomyces phaeoluteigriseus]